MNITDAPADLLILVLTHLGLAELLNLSATCHVFFNLIESYGWSHYHRHNFPRPSLSLSRLAWAPRTRVRHSILADRAWDTGNFTARPLGNPWNGKTQPLLAINSTRLVVASGSVLSSYLFGSKSVAHVLLEGSFSLGGASGKRKDVTAISFVPESLEPDRTLLVAFDDGTLERVILQPLDGRENRSMSFVRTAYPQNRPDRIANLSIESGTVLAFSAPGVASLLASSTMQSLSTVEMDARQGWTSYLCTKASSPYAAFGTSSEMPLRIHTIQEGQLSTRPSAVLHSGDNVSSSISSAVYGICSAPVALGSSNQIIVSGWFDGEVRVHDLRSDSRVTSTAGGLCPLGPVMRFNDPLSEESIYSLGSNTNHIAAGTARNSMVAVFDVRSSKKDMAYSIIAPGNDRSPVYSLVMESTRLWGATQSRAFVYDFGPDSKASSYPPLLYDAKLRKAGSGYYATTYRHVNPLS